MIFEARGRRRGGHRGADLQPRDFRRELLLTGIFSALLLVLSTPAAAQEQSGEAEHQEDFLQHELSFLVAGTFESPAVTAGHRDSDSSHHGSSHHNLTLGGEYEFRFHRLLGVGGTVEYITHEKNWLFVFPVYFHVFRGLKLVAGPGFERKHESADTEAVLRIGAMYAFEFAHRYSITPTVALDLIGRESAIVYGVNLGVAF